MDKLTPSLEGLIPDMDYHKERHVVWRWGLRFNFLMYCHVLIQILLPGNAK